eukprot:scaffold160378_cov33-Attheya_sp.AAC.1
METCFPWDSSPSPIQHKPFVRPFSPIVDKRPVPLWKAWQVEGRARPNAAIGMSLVASLPPRKFSSPL